MPALWPSSCFIGRFSPIRVVAHREVCREGDNGSLIQTNGKERQKLISHHHQPWAIRVSRADSSKALDSLMDAWYKGVTAGGGLGGAIGFDSHMERRDWESAKSSIERTYGRSSRVHQLTLDTLSAAIQSRKMLGPRLAS